MNTADLCDAFPDCSVCSLPFLHWGQNVALGGRIQTAHIDHRSGHILALLNEPGRGRILVIDAGGSRRTAVIGERMARLAIGNGWAGMVINGVIRDAEALDQLAFSVFALGTCPRRGDLEEQAQAGLKIQFGDVIFNPGDYLYADRDGVVVSDHLLVMSL